MIRRIALALILVLVTAVTVNAQVRMVQPDPVGNPGWLLPCDHPDAVARGFSCAPAPIPPKPDPRPNPNPPTDDECVFVNPYADPELAIRCAERPVAPDAVPAFIPGRTYSYAYNGFRAVVLGVTRDVDGVQVVTVRKLDGDKELWAFRTPPTPGGATAWFLVP